MVAENCEALRSLDALLPNRGTTVTLLAAATASSAAFHAPDIWTSASVSHE